MASEGNYKQAEWFYPQRTQHWVLYIKLILAAIFLNFSKAKHPHPTPQSHSKITNQTYTILLKEEVNDGRVFNRPVIGASPSTL